MSSDRLAVLAAEAALELAQPENTSDAAVAALEEGLDSPALRVLAGLSGADAGETREVLARALAELNVPIPSPRDAVTRLARYVAAEVVNGATAPYDGAKTIWQLTLRLPDQPFPELDEFVYAASEWEDREEDRSFFDERIRHAAHELSEAS